MLTKHSTIIARHHLRTLRDWKNEKSHVLCYKKSLLLRPNCVSLLCICVAAYRHANRAQHFLCYFCAAKTVFSWGSQQNSYQGSADRSHAFSRISDNRSWTCLAKKLSDQAINIWRAPNISEESLKRFKPEKPVLKAYTIADHPFLQSGITRILFEAFCKEIVNLDGNVQEEFLKHYIAYKAETSFADVLRQ